MTPQHTSFATLCHCPRSPPSHLAPMTPTGWHGQAVPCFAPAPTSRWASSASSWAARGLPTGPTCTRGCRRTSHGSRASPVWGPRDPSVMPSQRFMCPCWSVWRGKGGVQTGAATAVGYFLTPHSCACRPAGACMCVHVCLVCGVRPSSLGVRCSMHWHSWLRGPRQAMSPQLTAIDSEEQHDIGTAGGGGRGVAGDGGQGVQGAGCGGGGCRAESMAQ
jgi:hypothetical protein